MKTITVHRREGREFVPYAFNPDTIKYVKERIDGVVVNLIDGTSFHIREDLDRLTALIRTRGTYQE